MVRVFKPRQNPSTSWGKLAGTPSIPTSDPTRLTTAARALREKTSAVEEQREIELGLQATVMFAHQEVHASNLVDADPFVLDQVACVPEDTRENGSDRDLPAGL